MNNTLATCDRTQKGNLLWEKCTVAGCFDVAKCEDCFSLDLDSSAWSFSQGEIFIFFYFFILKIIRFILTVATKILFKVFLKAAISDFSNAAAATIFFITFL